MFDVFDIYKFNGVFYCDLLLMQCVFKYLLEDILWFVDNKVIGVMFFWFSKIDICNLW